jgi:hypothetical protein
MWGIDLGNFSHETSFAKLVSLIDVLEHQLSFVYLFSLILDLNLFVGNMVGGTTLRFSA